jgi:SpoIID/LytB domain protein
MRVRSALLACILTTLAAGPLIGPSSAPPARAQEHARIRFVAPPGASLLVHGTYPEASSPCASPFQPLMHARYPGTIEVGRDTDGKLFVIGELPFEEYLKGIAEVPRTWPLAALKAQVVAARSYALAHIDRPDETGERLGYQLCATDACQVYRGLGISGGPYGARWERAVEQTTGEVLLYRGRPAETLYSSTSPGYTLGNDQVFGSAPLPYLRPATEVDDGASPVSHWRVRLPHGDVRTFLQRAGHWGDQAVTSITLDGNTVVTKGGGKTEKLDTAHFRIHVNEWAACLKPDSYPTIDTDGIRLPQTIPSKWFEMSTDGDAVVLDGRGWGHAVGMVQWGAYGKAKRGQSYDQILAAYYGGLRPKPFATPDTIRVGIATGLTSVRISAAGEVTVVGGDPIRGPWRLTGGDRLHLARGGAPPRYIDAGRLTDVPDEGRAGRRLSAAVWVPQLSVVHLVFRQKGEDDIEITKPATHQAGTVEIEWTVPDVPSGTYELQAVFTNGIDIVRSGKAEFRLTGGTPIPTPTASPTPGPASPPAALAADRSGSPPYLPIALPILVLAAAALALLVLRRRRKSPATIPGDGSGM